MSKSELSEEQFIFKVKGESFRCDCGCNVFKKTKDGKYSCNGCRTLWIGEPVQKEIKNVRT